MVWGILVLHVMALGSGLWFWPCSICILGGVLMNTERMLCSLESVPHWLPSLALLFMRCEWSLVNYFVYLVFSVLIWEMGIIIVPYSWKNSLSCAGMLLPVSPNPIPAPWGNSLFSSSFYILGSNAWQLPHAHIYIVFFQPLLASFRLVFSKEILT